MSRSTRLAPIAWAAVLIGCGGPTYDVTASVSEREDVIWELWHSGSLEARRKLARVMLEETDERLRCRAAHALEDSSVKATEHPIPEMKEAFDAMLREAWANASGPLIADASPLLCVTASLVGLFRGMRGPGKTELLVHFLAAYEPAHQEFVSIEAAVWLRQPEHRAEALPHVQRLASSGEGTPRQRRWWLITCAGLERALDVDPATSPCAAADFDGHWASRRLSDKTAPSPREP